jgi:hypothetical protein
MSDDGLSRSLQSLADERRPSGTQQWQRAIQQDPRTTILQRLGGLASGLADIANRAWEASLPAHLRDMYRDLQAGAVPEDLAGRSMDAALRMLDYGLRIREHSAQSVRWGSAAAEAAG